MVLGFGKGEALSNVDAAWLHMEDRTNLMVISAVMAFHEPLDFNDVKTIIEDRFLCYDRFRQRIGCHVSHCDIRKMGFNLLKTNGYQCLTIVSTDPHPLRVRSAELGR